MRISYRIILAHRSGFNGESSILFSVTEISAPRISEERMAFEINMQSIKNVYLMYCVKYTKLNGTYCKYCINLINCNNSILLT